MYYFKFLTAVLFISTCFCNDLPCNEDSVFSRLSAYAPANGPGADYFTKDIHSQSLKTLQDYLKGDSAYVTVAMDENIVENEVPYGTVICIQKLNEKYGKNIRFEVRDTRPELKGLGFNRVAICVGTNDDTKEDILNSLVNVRLPTGTIPEVDDEIDIIRENSSTEDVNLPGLREDYQESRQYYSGGPYYPYYYPTPKTTTTTEKPYYYPYPYQPSYYPPFPPYPYYPPGNYENYYHHRTTTTSKPYYPPANPYYYYPQPSPYMYGYSNNDNYYNYTSYDYPKPNYGPMPIYYTTPKPSYGGYSGNYYSPPYGQYSQSSGGY